MSADTLTHKSRDFYERAKLKQCLSIVLAGAAIMSLGFCASYGGQSSNSDILNDITDDNDRKEILEALTSGFGFASFFFILAFILFAAASIYITPCLCGSANEKMMLTKPQELEAKSAV
jgi:hypothetical protein